MVALEERLTKLVVIRNWKTGKQLVLDFSGHPTVRDFPRQVAFVHGKIFVIRDLSVHIFNQPQMPLRSDCTIMAIQQVSRVIGSFAFEPMSSYDQHTMPSLSSMIAFGLNQTSNLTELQFYKVNDCYTDGNLSPCYPASSSSLRCIQNITNMSTVHHGPFGTAVWTADGLHGQVLIVAAFPGPYNDTSELQVKLEVAIGGIGKCDCLDYDEIEGLILVRVPYERLKIFDLCPLV